MACNTSLTSILKSCDNNVASLSAIYIIPANFVTGTTSSAGTINTISLSGSNKFSTFEFNKNSASFTEVGTLAENGSASYVVTLTLAIPRREVSKRNAIALLGAGNRDLICIIKDGNGIYHYMGKENFANLTEVGGGVEAALNGFNGYNLTLLSTEPALMYEVNSTIVSALIA